MGEEPGPAEQPELPDELIDEMLAGARTPEEIAGPDGLLSRLTKRLVERAMDAISSPWPCRLTCSPPTLSG